jgi:ubiquitin
MTTATAETPARPEVRELAALDIDAARRGADEWVAHRIGTAQTAEDRLKQANDLVADLARAAVKARQKRDAAAWTLETEYHCRRGASIADALGVGRTRWKSIRDRFKAADVKPDLVPHAPERLPVLAYRVAQLEAQEKAALKVRQRAASELAAAGVSKAAIARMIDRDPARVSHLIAGTK